MTYEPPKRCFQGSPLRLCTLRMTLVGRYFWTWPLKYITSTSGNKWNKIWQSRDSTAIYGTKVYQSVLIAGALEVRSSILDARYEYVFVWMKPSLGQSICWEQRPRISRICRLFKNSSVEVGCSYPQPMKGKKNCKQVTVCPTLNLAGGAFFSPSALAEELSASWLHDRWVAAISINHVSICKYH